MDTKTLVLLYVDDSEESKEAISLLESQGGINLHVVHGNLDDGWEYPLAQVSTWQYEGLEEIISLLRHLPLLGVRLPISQ